MEGPDFLVSLDTDHNDSSEAPLLVFKATLEVLPSSPFAVSFPGTGPVSVMCSLWARYCALLRPLWRGGLVSQERLGTRGDGRHQARVTQAASPCSSLPPIHHHP